jgi:hypothetical protein
MPARRKDRLESVNCSSRHDGGSKQQQQQGRIDQCSNNLWGCRALALLWRIAGEAHEEQGAGNGWLASPVTDNSNSRLGGRGSRSKLLNIHTLFVLKGMCCVVRGHHVRLAQRPAGWMTTAAEGIAAAASAAAEDCSSNCCTWQPTPP